jgi:hypothetical protein
MQTRLFASLAGGLLGVALNAQITAKLGLDLPPVPALIGCSLAGLAIGYVVSLLVDVFTGHSVVDRADSKK